MKEMKEIREIREIAATYDARELEKGPVVIEQDKDAVVVAMTTAEYHAFEKWLNRQYEQRQWTLLAPEVEAYKGMLPELLRSHKGKWVAIYHGELIDSAVERVLLIKRTRQVHPHQVIYYVLVEEQHPPAFDMDTPEGDQDFVSLQH